MPQVVFAVQRVLVGLFLTVLCLAQERKHSEWSIMKEVILDSRGECSPIAHKSGLFNIRWWQYWKYRSHGSTLHGIEWSERRLYMTRRCRRIEQTSKVRSRLYRYTIRSPCSRFVPLFRILNGNFTWPPAPTWIYQQPGLLLSDLFILAQKMLPVPFFSSNFSVSVARWSYSSDGLSASLWGRTAV